MYICVCATVFIEKCGDIRVFDDLSIFLIYSLIFSICADDGYMRNIEI